MQVIGMGEEKTPKPFISACNQFKYLDLLYSNQQKEEKEEKEKEEKEVLEKTSASKAGSAAEKAAEAKIRDLKRIRKTVNAIIDKLSDEEGWLDCGKLGDQLSKRLPDFDVRNYGYSKLTPFIKSLGDYDVQKISMGGGQKQIYFRMKTKKTGKA